MDADKHQSFLWVDFHTLNIKVSCIVTLSLFMGMIKHAQSAQSNKFTICLTMSQKRSLWWTSFFGCRLTSVSASSKYYSCRIKGTFGAIIRVWAPTKWTQKINLKFLGKLDDLNSNLWIKYSVAEEKHGDYMKKYATAT